MKKFFILIAAFLVCTVSNAQLTIYSNLNQQGTSATCVARTVFINTSIPGGLNNLIKSITLNQGFQAVLAENADGSGESFCYVANVSALNVNLAFELQNKVSFIRVLPLPSTPIKKKGAGEQNNSTRDSLKVTWWYDWGRGDASTTTQSYVPMMWGAYNTFEATMNDIVSLTNVTHLLAFNEPDSRTQGGGSLITTDPLVAVPYYKKMLRSGMRMGSPATTEGQYNNWLSDFTDEAKRQNLRVDHVAVHWYDWGNVCGSFTGCDLTMPIASRPVSMDVNAIFNRFTAYITNVYNLHKKPIWITEFHAHDVRPNAVHEAFMRLALPWLDANPNVERYAYFFGDDVAARDTINGRVGPLSGPGKVYSDHVSVNAYTENIYDTRSASAETVLASWESSTQTGGGVTSFAPTSLNGGMTATSALTRGTGVGLATGSSAGYWGGNNFSTATTAATGVTDSKFLKFSLKPNNGKAVNYISIDKFNIRISSTGPIKYQVDYQIDNGAFSPCKTIALASRPTASTNYVLDPIDLTGIAGLQNVPASKTVTFRITPFEASATTGAFLIGSGQGDTDADLSIVGSFASDIVTPVSLSDFQSKKVKDKVLLTWLTQSEVNFSHFVLERSTDGKAFYEVTKVNASKRSGGSKYDYTDAPDATGTNYYRLKMVDTDGSFVYSKIVSESFDGSNTPLMVYPSIATHNKIDVVFKAVSADAQIKIYNIMGQLVSTRKLQVDASSESIDLATFTEGAYFLVLQDKGTIQSKKFIKQ